MSQKQQEVVFKTPQMQLKQALKENKTKQQILKILQENHFTADLTQILHLLLQESENPELIHAFVSKYNDFLNFQTKLAPNPLFKAVQKNDLPLVQLLLKNKTLDVNQQRLGTKPFKLAIEKGNDDIINLFLERDDLKVSAKHPLDIKLPLQKKEILHKILNHKNFKLPFLIDRVGVLETPNLALIQKLIKEKQWTFTKTEIYSFILNGKSKTTPEEHKKILSLMLEHLNPTENRRTTFLMLLNGALGRENIQAIQVLLQKMDDKQFASIEHSRQMEMYLPKLQEEDKKRVSKIIQQRKSKKITTPQIKPFQVQKTRKEKLDNLLKKYFMRKKLTPVQKEELFALLNDQKRITRKMLGSIFKFFN